MPSILLPLIDAYAVCADVTDEVLTLVLHRTGTGVYVLFKVDAHDMLDHNGPCLVQ